MINGVGRKKEGFVFVKNLSLEETSSGQTFFFFFTRILHGRCHAGILYNILQNEFFFFYASLIMIYRIVLMSPISLDRISLNESI